MNVYEWIHRRNYTELYVFVPLSFQEPLEFFHKGSQTELNLSYLPGHIYQWNKTIIYVAQLQFCLFVLLVERIHTHMKEI